MVKIKRSCEIEDELSFDANDILGRKGYGESLANLISNSSNESLVISINADWGEGKTYFLNMWKKYLETERGLNVIYFDAFKNDFIDDPFVPLLGEIIKYYKDDASNLEKITDKGKNILKGIIPLSGKIISRIALGGDMESVDDELEKLLEGDISQFVGKTLEEYTKKDKSITLFKETLEEIIEEKGQLVFIIDELDRCRPDFAVRLLERIKHFFDIKGLYFILGIHKEQLEKYIENVYGNIDSSTYLQKFIDIETILPKDLRGDYYSLFIKNCLNHNGDILTEKLEPRMKDYIERLFIDFAKGLNLSLRDIEKISNYLIMFYKSLPSKNYLNMPMVIFFIILVKVFDIELYKKFKEGNIKKEEVLNVLKIEEYNYSSYKEDFLEELDFIFDEELGKDVLDSYKSIYSRYFIDIDSLKGRKEVLNIHLSILDSFKF